ncbi:MAG: PhoU domain-containing protein [Ignisphaera sp.]
MLLINELERLRSILLHMAEHTHKVMIKTSELFNESNTTVRESLWREIDEISSILDRIRREFVNEVLVFIARRQPLGKELLIAHTLISIAYDVYRISRYCREIARIDIMLTPESIASIKGASEMFRYAIKAVENALKDLVELKPVNERAILEIDNNVDTQYRALLKEVISREYVDRSTSLKVLIMRHIERIVDHANYIEDHLKLLT